MPDSELAQRLTNLFMDTGHAHHQAFIETDGYDPDWPLWYADHLREQVAEHLGATFTISELVYLLVLVDKEHRLHASGEEWPPFYARFFMERYPESEE